MASAEGADGVVVVAGAVAAVGVVAGVRPVAGVGDILTRRIGGRENAYWASNGPEEVTRMPNGYGFRGGWGFGFRGASPPWPYVGVGRGGLPRCWHFVGATGAPVPGSYARFPRGYYGPGWTPFSPEEMKEQELGFLRREAEELKGALEDIEGRIRELESEETEPS